MLTLEHLKLLTLRAAPIEMGTGGTPEITFQEVCDLMSRLSSMTNDYARYSFARDDSRKHALEQGILWQLVLQRQDLLPMRDMVEVVRRVVGDYVFTHNKFEKVKKKERIVYDAAWQVIDGCDFELRSEVRKWNEDNLDLASS